MNPTQTTQNLESSVFGLITMQYKLWSPESVATEDNWKCGWQIQLKLHFFQWFGCLPFWIQYGQLLMNITLSLDLYNKAVYTEYKYKPETWQTLINYVFFHGLSVTMSAVLNSRWLAFYLKVINFVLLAAITMQYETKLLKV